MASLKICRNLTNTINMIPQRLAAWEFFLVFLPTKKVYYSHSTWRVDLIDSSGNTSLSGPTYIGSPANPFSV